MQLLYELEKKFIENKNPQLAVKQSAYMRNRFHFFGISKPEQTQYEKPLFKKHHIDSTEDLKNILLDLFKKEQREFHYTACHLAYYKSNLWTPDMLLIFEYMIRNHSWWDTVDEIAARLVGTLIVKFPSEIVKMDEWIKDDHLWIRRTALIFQLRLKKATDTDRLASYCQKVMEEKDFFIRKAIGWCLREYSKTNPSFVQNFINTHKDRLSPLSVREGSKYLK